MTADPTVGAVRGEPAPEGVPLDRYAAVLAMRGEGISLDEAVLRGGVDARVWASAERAWEARIEKADEAFLGELDAALAAAQDRLARPVPPIDRDLGAWLDFIRHWTASPSPMELLESLHLRVQDVFRLQRAWGQRLKDDAALRQMAGSIMQQPLGPMPAIRPEPLALDPLPPPAPEPARPAGAEKASPLPRLVTPLPELESAEAPLSPPEAKPPATWSPSASFVPEGMRHFTNLHETQAVSSVAHEKTVLPFQAEASDSARALAPPMAPADAVLGPRKGPEDGRVGGMTGDISSAMRAMRVLPFEAGAAPKKLEVGSHATPEKGSVPPLSPVGALMSLEQYASLCVEIALSPAKFSDILLRYRLTAEQRAALDAHWQGRMAREPGVRAAWERACVTYQQWLLEQRGRG